MATEQNKDKKNEKKPEMKDLAPKKDAKGGGGVGTKTPSGGGSLLGGGKIR